MFVAILLGVFVMSSNNVKATEEVVFNPDSNGTATHVYEDVQYTSARDIDIKINIEQEDLDEFDTMFDVCEFIYTYFKSSLNREVICRQLLPYVFDIDLDDPRYSDKFNDAFYEYDASEEKVFNDVVYMLVIFGATALI